MDTTKSTTPFFKRLTRRIIRDTPLINKTAEETTPEIALKSIGAANVGAVAGAGAGIVSGRGVGHSLLRNASKTKKPLIKSVATRAGGAVGAGIGALVAGSMYAHDKLKKRNQRRKYYA